MPEISRFFGVVIAMFYDEHNPPHFHARYGENKAIVDINELKIKEGALPPRVLGFVLEWSALHKAELLSNWELARNNQALKPIKPLE